MIYVYIGSYAWVRVGKKQKEVNREVGWIGRKRQENPKQGTGRKKGQSDKKRKPGRSRKIKNQKQK